MRKWKEVTYFEGSLLQRFWKITRKPIGVAGNQTEIRIISRFNGCLQHVPHTTVLGTCTRLSSCLSVSPYVCFPKLLNTFRQYIIWYLGMYAERGPVNLTSFSTSSVTRLYETKRTRHFLKKSSPNTTQNANLTTLVFLGVIPCSLVDSYLSIKITKRLSFIKFYSHQLMHFFIQLCISLLSYIKIT